jgi:NADH:ubiquinone oxidoreductase subunit D
MVVSDGGERPRRVRFRSPDFAHLAAIGEILIDVPVTEVPLAVASLDICVGGVDR